MEKIAQRKQSSKPIRLEAVLDALETDKVGDTYPAWNAFADAADGIVGKNATKMTREQLVAIRRALFEAIQATDRVLAKNQRTRMRVVSGGAR